MTPLPHFNVQVGKPEFIQPQIPTPHEFKYLSNIDDQAGLRNHTPFVHFYPPNITAARGGGGCFIDPVPVIRMGLSKALVHYYPIAGRLRNAENGKLVVDCCGEGVLFREAKCDSTLERLREVGGGLLQPPFPQWDSLLMDDVWGSDFVIDSPLLRFQVTRLSCGGFVLAYTYNHCVCDAFGVLQFITAISEFCQNPRRDAPSITPSWGRETLKPRTPPRVSYVHPEYDLDHPSSKSQITLPTQTDFRQLAQTSVFLSNADIANLKAQINGGKCATFDAMASCLWRARTRVILKPESIAKLLFPADTRFRYKPRLPNGYYGSSVVFPCVSAKASDLVEKPLSNAAKLISKIKKGIIGDEYRASALDFIELSGRRGFCEEGAFMVTDMSKLNFVDIDFGWGSAVYGGPLRAGAGPVPGMVTPVVHHKNENGVAGLLALFTLPSQALEKFHADVRKQVAAGSAPVSPISAL